MYSMPCSDSLTPSLKNYVPMSISHLLGLCITVYYMRILERKFRISLNGSFFINASIYYLENYLLNFYLLLSMLSIVNLGK
jgi:hypothetical protein